MTRLSSPHVNPGHLCLPTIVQVMRIFHDRLICAEDKALVCERAETLVQQKFPNLAQHAMQTPLLYGDYK